MRSFRFSYSTNSSDEWARAVYVSPTTPGLHRIFQLHDLLARFVLSEMTAAPIPFTLR